MNHTLNILPLKTPKNRGFCFGIKFASIYSVTHNIN